MFLTRASKVSKARMSPEGDFQAREDVGQGHGMTLVVDLSARCRCFLFTTFLREPWRHFAVNRCRAPPRLVFTFQPLKATLPTAPDWYYNSWLMTLIAFPIQFFHGFTFIRLCKALGIRLYSNFSLFSYSISLGVNLIKERSAFWFC